MSRFIGVTLALEAVRNIKIGIDTEIWQGKLRSCHGSISEHEVLEANSSDSC